MTNTEFLLDTLAYYTENTERRCTDGSGGCFYSPVTARNLKSAGCAIGRHLPTNVQRDWDSSDGKGEGTGIKTISEKYLEWSKAPSWMRELPIEFLNRIQKLHDDDLNWSSNSLSTYGVEHVKDIISDFSLNTEDFKQYIG